MREKKVDHRQQVLFARAIRQAKQDDAGVGSGRVDQRIRELLVERDKAAALGGAHRDERGVGGSLHALLKDRGGVVTRPDQTTGRSASEILVNLESQAVFLGTE